MRRLTVILATLLLLSSGCQKSEEDCCCMDVSLPSSTKVHLEGLSTCWDSGDKVSVFYQSDKNECWTFEGQAGARNGVLKGNDLFRVKNRSGILAVWPYDADATSPEDNAVTTHIPVMQNLKEGTYSDAVLAGYAAEGRLDFEYCTSVVVLDFTGPAEVIGVELQSGAGEKIAGESSISFIDGRPLLTCTGEPMISMPCSVSLSEGECRSFMFSTAPVSFENGYSFTVKFRNGKSQTVKVSDRTELLPGRMYRVESSYAGKPKDIKEAYLLFSDGTQRYNPFTTDIVFRYGEEIGPYVVSSEDGDFPFRFFCHSPNETKDNFRITNGGGLYIGGSEGDYIQLPGVDGYMLEKIEVALHKPSDFKISGTQVSCTGTDGGEYRIVVMKQAVEGQSYRMELAGVSCFRSIRLTYRRAGT